jgi:hypothetical protein
MRGGVRTGVHAGPCSITWVEQQSSGYEQVSSDGVTAAIRH